MKRALWFLPAPLVCLAVFWRAPFIWFRIDDFAWLSLPLNVTGFGSLLYELFHPAAQGTIRVLSERLYFLVLTSLFGVTSWPFRAVTLATWFADLALMQVIGARLAGSRAAGLLAAVLWTMSVALVTPLVWASAYNEVMFALVILAAFYARLRWLDSGERRWLWTEAAVFLAGFGVLEVVVMYPALVLLHAALDPRARAGWRTALWMLIPAGAFTLAHLFWIPKTTSPIYQLSFDARLPANLWRYLEWTIGPSQMEVRNPARQFQGLAVTWAIAAALATFVAVRLRRRDRTPLFLCGWFLLLLAPMLPLANHIQDYYLTVPGIGLAWLGGWALASAWRAGLATRVLGVALALAYAAGSIVEVDSVTAWNLRITSQIRVFYRAVEATLAKYPGSAIVLTGLSDEVFLNSVPHRPFLLLGAERVWLPPGADAVLDTTGLDLARHRTTRQELLGLLAAGDVHVLDVSGGTAYDVTGSYGRVLAAEFLAAHREMVDVGNPAYEGRLGAGWFPMENGTRWSGKRAIVTLYAPETARHLRIMGYAPPNALAAGPLTLRIALNGRQARSKVVRAAGQLDVAVPLAEHGWVEVQLECSRTFRPPGDGRDLGLVFGTFAAVP